MEMRCFTTGAVHWAWAVNIWELRKWVTTAKIGAMAHTSAAWMTTMAWMSSILEVAMVTTLMKSS